MQTSWADKWEQTEQNMSRKQHGFLLLEGVGGGEREGWEDSLWKDLRKRYLNFVLISILTYCSFQIESILFIVVSESCHVRQ